MTFDLTHLTLSAQTPIDLQTHTHLSDGQWTPEQLIDHFISEGFGLAAITDHDRVDTAPMLQALAIKKGFPLLVAAEMTTKWRGQLTDVLCFGFALGDSPLNSLAQDVQQRQSENSRLVYENCARAGHIPLFDAEEMARIAGAPAAQQPHDLYYLLAGHNPEQPETWLGKSLKDAGFVFATNDLAEVVDAGHRSGALVLIAHPGRGREFMLFDAPLLDELRAEIPIDGIEAYYPRHSPEQVADYVAYADANDLLVSSGSDSHAPDGPPIKYPAELSRRLLSRLGLELQPGH